MYELNQERLDCERCNGSGERLTAKALQAWDIYIPIWDRYEGCPVCDGTGYDLKQKDKDTE